MDGGYLGLWSGAGAPEAVREDTDRPATDFEIVGPDAEVAARTFDRQSGCTLYDIPQHGVAEFTTLFNRHCAERGLHAELRAFPQQVPHRDRTRRAIASGDPDFVITGVSVVPVGGLPTDRPLLVVGVQSTDWGWTHIRITVSEEPVAQVMPLGGLAVDNARFVFADADALGAWVHDAPIDGLADVVLWGLHGAEIAAEFGALPTTLAGESNFGWLNLPVEEAYAKAVALDDLRNSGTGRKFNYDFRPHSHHWRVMADVRAAEHEAATIEVGGARLMFAMTSVGDGFFPVNVELDAAGSPVAIQISIADESDE